MLLRMGSLSVEFNVWNPLYAFAPFVLLLVSIPLAGFAIVTTSLAVTLLSFRALVVYFQLGVALVSAWLSPPLPKSSSRPSDSQSTASPQRSSPTRSRRRRSSNGSTASQDTAVPAANNSRLSKKSGSLITLIGTSDMTRDFEGVGGWRVAGDEDEEALWMGLNSRLQLPADVPIRQHKRSLTSGAIPSQRWNWSPEALRMSPVQSRARTPIRFSIEDEAGYFPPQSMTSIRPMSSSSDPLKHHKRRKSGSSVSSTGSAAGTMMAVEEAGE
ncbi:hypothetical protein BKA66DRAFT_448242 [Pyrenochaeta sp. MPI-SDFR-AT-0127]|nr:hypothetical protein BKA66DRAFT_448242 [Pyrenochaeta sp. MPI-SDFR-AT-0127]